MKLFTVLFCILYSSQIFSQKSNNTTSPIHVKSEPLLAVLNADSEHNHYGVSHSHNSRQAHINNDCLVDLPFSSEVSITENEKKDLRIITSNAIPNHAVGEFPRRGNPNTITEQTKTYKIDLTPKIAAGKTFVYDLGMDRGRPNYVFGVAINGVKFEPSANEYFKNTETNKPNYEWTLEALSPEVNLGEDCNNAHVQPNGEYHYHGTPNGLVAFFDDKKMNLVGWAADGFPMYYKVAYKDPMDTGSDIVELKSSYVIKSGHRPGEGISAPNGEYSGKFVRDYEFDVNSGDLDECNGRFGITPEFPDGTYYYIVSDEFPSASRCFMGTPSSDFKIGGGNRGQRPQQDQNRERRENNNTTSPSFSELLKRMDRNGDGKISQSEAKGPLKEHFIQRDKNKDGYLEESEIKQKEE